MTKLSIFLTLVAVFLCANSAIFGQVIITNTTPVTQNFDTMGATATASLPLGWKVDSVAPAPTTVYANAAGATTATAGTSGTGILTSTSGGGTYNFANGITATSTDRAVGWLTSGSYSSPRQMFVQLTNNSGQTLTSLAVNFDIEKYRSGSRAYNINFFSSTDGTNWTAQTAGDQAFAADATNTVIFNPPTAISKTATISGLTVANGDSIYLRWSYTGTGGNTNAQGLGIDNFSATPTFASVSNVDLTVSRTASDSNFQGEIISYELYVANGGTSNASNVKATFTAPSQFNVTNTFTDCGFTVSRVGNAVTYTGGTVNAGASCNLTIRATSPTAGIKVTANAGDAVVDPDNTIAETSETNNATTDTAVTRIYFPNTVTGLYGRTSLAQLLADIADIGGGYTIILNQNLVENSDLNLPSGRSIDLGSFVISGTANIHFGGGFYDGFKTSHPNGIGDATHPGNFQTTGIVTYTDAVDTEYYALIPALSELGTSAQTAYGHPAQIQSFTINNQNGVNFIAPFSVASSFNLTNGIVNNGANTITLSAQSQINGDNNGAGSETSFIAGKMTKFLPGFGGEKDNGISFNFVFPVGTLGGPQAGYSPLKVANYFGSDFDAGLTVQAFDTNSPGVTTPSISRYWQIDEIGNMVTDMQFFWRTGDDAAITNPADATIIRNNQMACSGNCTINMANKTASITQVSNFSPWSVAQRVTTAAGATISGRVLNSNGTGEYRAKIYATDQNGETRTATANSFGYYRFEGLRAGETYTLNVKVKQAQYAPRIVSVNDDVLNFDFIPQE